ncbi:hypothetical protein A9Q95_11275 [Rhodobacterales bacterium 59_46_T64]|nr:hypothetical protein A9Q95_11275 [Rhodobacterales bacterium 59_46_T64]
MPHANTTQRYGSVTKTFHWLTAFVILVTIPVGWLAHELSVDLRSGSADAASVARVAFLFSLHKTLGVAAFFVALGRILWATGQTKPGLINGNHRIEALTAEVVHWTLYGTMLLVPLSGWVHHAATSGFAPIWWPFGQTLPLVPRSAFVAEASEVVHFLSGRLMMVSIAMHVAGAVKHHVIDKDATLRRMLPRGGSAQPSAQQPSHILPAGMAALLLAATLFAGWTAADGSEDHTKGAIAQTEGTPQSTSTQAQPDAAGIDATQSAATTDLPVWEVQNGEITIAVQQFGSQVTGGFGTWDADIIFDPEADRNKGTVDVRIQIASLSLGSVTEQALGADFFDAATHPEALFEAQIIEEAGALFARGALIIKDNAMPVTLPFSLDITETLEGKEAKMRGTLRLDRRDFGIGLSMDDEGSLGFAVDVTVSLTATQAP